jgi:hypothetical protein
MSRTVSRGYREPSPACFNPSEWRVTPSGRVPLADPMEVAHWDYATDLLVERTLSVEIDALRTQALLDSADELRCIIQWTSTSTDLQGASDPTVLTGGSNELRCSVPGIEIGGILKLRTTVSVAVASADDRNPLAARRSGSILWSDDFQLVLEGDATRFPTEALSFKANGQWPLSCAWRVAVETSDLDAPALSAVRVILNTDHPAHKCLADTPDSPEAALTRQFLAYDVARQLVISALMNDEFIAVDYDRGSIGDILRARLKNYFLAEGDEVEPLRQRWRTSPADIDAELQPFFLGGNEVG